MKILLLAGLILVQGCAQVADFTLKDVGAAKARAERNSDASGLRCWQYIEAQLKDGSADLEIAGVMDAVQAARTVRLRAPELRKEIMAGCGEVFADIVIELAKKAAKRGF